MITYAANILPKDAVYYTLQNASISNGRILMDANGSATIDINTTQLASLATHFRVSAYASVFSDMYRTDLSCAITAQSVSGKYFHYLCNLTANRRNVYSTDIEMVSEEYVLLRVILHSVNPCTINTWELCPEAIDGTVETIIDGVKQSLPRLLYDYNIWPVTVAQREKTIAIITCDLLQNTDIQGHLNLVYDVTETSIITLRFKDNAATELFAPLFYDVQAGRGTIGVPHAYLKRLKGYHNFTVTAQVSTGSMIIGTRGILFTIDGGYVASRMLDIGASVNDFTIEQLATDLSPRNIWILSEEAGELMVRRRPYNASASSTAFEPLYTLGHGIDGAIEFDGNWVLTDHGQAALHRLNTQSVPYVFFIDNSHRLYRQYGAIIDTKTLIDTNVTGVSACRGFKSDYYLEQDQGLIVLYIKNAQAWYVQYVYDTATQDYLWTTPIRVGQYTDVKHVHVHRLNDYRVGFCITTSDTNYWLISKRTYIGQAFKPEVVNMSASADTLVSIFKYPDLPEPVTCVGALSDDRLTITGTFNYPVKCVAADIMDGLSMATQLSSNINNVTLSGTQLTITLNTPARAPYDITIVAWPYWQYEFQNQWTRINDNIVFSYDPYGHLTALTEEATQFNIASSAITLQLRPVITKTPATQIDVVNPNVAALTTVITQTAVTMLPHNTNDTAGFNVANLTATVQLLLVGTDPI